MASFFEMLFQTMPFAAVAQSLWETKNKTIDELTAADMRQHVTLLADQASIYVELPARDVSLEPDAQPLWAFSYTTAHPAEVGSLYCRVRDADYVGHHVADRVAWGLEDKNGAFKPEVRVQFQAGGDLRLPLTADYLLWAFRVRGGHLTEDQSSLWRLESNLDTSIVAVFAYDIDPATGQLTKTDFDKVLDPTLREELQEMSRAVKELLGDPKSEQATENDEDRSGAGTDGDPLSQSDNPPQAAGGAMAMSIETSIDKEPPADVDPVPPPAPPEEKPWGQQVLRGGDFWPAQEKGPPPGVAPVPMGVDGEVGQTVDVQTEPARLLVVFSLTTCCERADFEPGGIVGFARCYPHLLVSSTAPVAIIEGSAHIDRPKALSKWHENDRDMSASCCKPPYDGWTQEIGALLVADANGSADDKGPPLPFWSNMFFYYMIDPFLKHGSKRYHIVRRDRPDARDSTAPLVRREVVGMLSGVSPWEPEADSDDCIVRKEARQGAFDNIHMAPRLRLMNVAEVVDPAGFNSPRYPISNRSEWHLDDIAMAPFCAHDCLHLHWRWATSATPKWSQGWDASGPHQVQGAPQVPLEQDVWLSFRRRASITYHVQAVSPRFIDGWHVLMHHGFGYAVSIQATIRAWVAMFAVDSVSRVFFIAPDGDLVEAQRSTAAYYWKARFAYDVVDGKATPRERLSVLSEELLLEAMDL